MKSLVMKNLIVFIVLLSGTSALAQKKVYPVIQDYGFMLEMPFETIQPDPDLDYKLLAETPRGQKDKTKLYEILDYFAKVVNAHAYAGVPRENFKMSVVLYSGSAYTALTHEEYNERFGNDNPNLELLERFQEAGVDVIICGQSMMKQNMRPEDIAEGIKIGSSRITISSELMTKGYIPIL